MKNSISSKQLLKWFIKEEYRMFETLFGTKRLLAFPVTLLLLGLILGLSIPALGTSIELAIGIVALVAAMFGLQTGSVGFEAQDTIEDLMGDTSRILFASRTLPISRNRLATIFLIKDILVYSVLMLLPIFVGIVVGLYATPIGSGYDSLSIALIIQSYVLMLTSFTFGVSAGFALTTVDFGQIKSIIATVSVLSVPIVVAYGFHVNYGLLELASIGVISGLLLLSSAVFVIVGVWQFGLVADKKKVRHHDNIIGVLSDHRTDSVVPQIAIKTIIDIVRTPGGVWKILFSTGAIALAGLLTVGVTKQVMTTGMKPEILYAGILSLSAFPIYTLVYRYDSNSYYSNLPVVSEQVIKAKSLAYTITSVLTIGAYYTILVLLSGVSVTSYLLGLSMLVSLVVYQLGIFLVVAKDKPLKFLFNGALFSGYSIAILCVMTPVALAGLYGTLLPSVVTLLSVSVGFVALLTGLALLAYQTK